MIRFLIVNALFDLYTSEALDVHFALDNCTCGVRPSSAPKGRIYGGVEAEESEFPWNVALYYRDRVFCGGSIINSHYVLTAAHCFKSYNWKQRRITLIPPNRVKIFVGSSYITFGTVEKGKRILPDIRIPLIVNIHPRYNLLGASSDIALVRIHKTFEEFTPKILPVCLPPFGYTFADAVGIVSGWGRREHETDTFETRLRKAEIKVFSPKVCEFKLQRTYLRDVMICAASPGKDSCKGDSGGPLITKLTERQYMQIGITSFGFKCGDYSKPGVYTKVNEFVPWIMKRTREASYCYS